MSYLCARGKQQRLKRQEEEYAEKKLHSQGSLQRKTAEAGKKDEESRQTSELPDGGEQAGRRPKERVKQSITIAQEKPERMLRFFLFW